MLGGKVVNARLSDTPLPNALLTCPHCSLYILLSHKSIRVHTKKRVAFKLQRTRSHMGNPYVICVTQCVHVGVDALLNCLPWQPKLQKNQAKTDGAKK